MIATYVFMKPFFTDIDSKMKSRIHNLKLDMYQFIFKIFKLLPNPG